MAKRKRNQQERFPDTRKRVEINPITPTQREYLRTINNHDITFGIGPAGTGKTYLATLMAMQYQTEGWVDKIVICRPAVDAGEKLGFLPGSINQKMDPYVRPIYDTLYTYWSPTTVNDYLGRGTIEISPLAYMRGRTFRNTFIVADEMENCTVDQMLMLLTRFGEGSKMVVTGDPYQSDIKGDTLNNSVKRVNGVSGIGIIKFTKSDIIRHPVVKNVLKVWNRNDNIADSININKENGEKDVIRRYNGSGYSGGFSKHMEI